MKTLRHIVLATFLPVTASNASQHFYQNESFLLSPLGLYETGYGLGNGISDYSIEFDFKTHDLNPSWSALLMIFDIGSVQDFILHGLGFIEAPPPNSTYLPGWTDDEWHHLRIDANLTGGIW